MISKRKLLRLVNEGRVSGWDDPRMPTLSGMRRRGVTPEAIRAFCDMIGVTKANTRIDVAKLEFAIRDDLNRRVPRVMAVADPLKVVVTNWPEDGRRRRTRRARSTRTMSLLKAAANCLSAASCGSSDPTSPRTPPKGFRRLSPGVEVRLRYGYLVTCTDVVKDDDGNVVELHCTYDPDSRGGDAPDGRKVKGTIHWVAAGPALPSEFRMYDPALPYRRPRDVAEGEDWIDNLNPDSLVVQNGWIEPSVKDDPKHPLPSSSDWGYFNVGSRGFRARIARLQPYGDSA